MTRRERLERKIERRRDWAVSAETKATREFNTSQSLVAGIPMGQPVLIGHHSEHRHRRTLDRSWNALGRSVELTKKAEMHVSKAGNLEHMLDKAIFSDDSDAVEAIQERIQANEAKRERMKKINAMYRKGDAAGLAAVGLNLETLRENLKTAYSWCQQPHPAYELQNLGGRIQADKKRLQAIKAQQERQQEAAATENGVTVKNHENGYTSVTFAEKPERSILSALRDAGFRWGSGCWFGQTENVPACVAELVETKEPNTGETSWQI